MNLKELIKDLEQLIKCIEPIKIFKEPDNELTINVKTIYGNVIEQFKESDLTRFPHRVKKMVEVEYLLLQDKYNKLQA
jgi:carbon monoxide dehydrogenase subunit G